MFYERKVDHSDSDTGQEQLTPFAGPKNVTQILRAIQFNLVWQVMTNKSALRLLQTYLLTYLRGNCCHHILKSWHSSGLWNYETHSQCRSALNWNLESLGCVIAKVNFSYPGGIV